MLGPPPFLSFPGTSTQLQAVRRGFAPGPCFMSACWPRASAADPQCSPVRRPHYTSCTLGAKCRCPSALTPTSRFWRPMSASALKPFQAQGFLAHQGFVRRHTGNPWGLYKLCCCTLLMMLSDILLELDWRRTCHVAF